MCFNGRKVFFGLYKQPERLFGGALPFTRTHKNMENLVPDLIHIV